MTKSFSLFHSNLRSLSPHFDELQLLLTALKSQLMSLEFLKHVNNPKGF